MKKKLLTLCILILSITEAHVTLDNLIAGSKTDCFEELKRTQDQALWHVFLAGQTELFFDSEFQWISKSPWWKQAEYIVEIGSGNGSYLSKLAEKFQDKRFKGIELLPKSVEHAKARYSTSRLSFEEGNAEVYNRKLENKADIVLFRLTLQHLKDPFLAVEQAANYLSSKGHLVIIESYDEAKKTSHPIQSIDQALDLAAQSQKAKKLGNRKASFNIMQAIEDKDSKLANLYEIVYSNLDLTGNSLESIICFQGEKDRKLYFNHSLLFSELVRRTYQVPVDLNAVYDELQGYLKDENAWTCIGAHFLVLKKRDQASN